MSNFGGGGLKDWGRGVSNLCKNEAKRERSKQRDED